MARYLIEIYSPGTTDEVSRSYEGNTLFPSFARGDKLTFMADSIGEALVARVSGIEHFIRIVADGEYHHKICIFTEEIGSAD